MTNHSSGISVKVPGYLTIHLQVVSTIIKPRNYIWVPNYAVYNYLKSKTGEYLRGADLNVAQVQRNGWVNYLEYTDYELMCSMELKRFPFDYQCCELEMGPASKCTTLNTHSSIHGKRE